VVHDNKLPGEARLGRITLGASPRYDPIPWPRDFAVPIDLEAISAIPGEPGLYLVTTSGGTATLLHLDGDRITVRGATTLPDRPALPNFEGLSVQQVGTRLVVAWGHRGAGAQPGRLFWGSLTLDPLDINEAGATEIRVPFPTPSSPNTRHISDLKIDRDGRLWLSAANDPGDAGPFESAVYDAGVFSSAETGVAFTPRTPLQPFRTFKRKVEAIDTTDDGRHLVLGTDDEWEGAAIARIDR
jgi:hypothetical protein